MDATVDPNEQTAPPSPRDGKEAASVVSTGSVLGRYQLTRLLGEGAMGSVYLAEDPVLKREVAVKVIRTDHLDWEQLARFEREAMAVAQVQHPNTVTVHDVLLGGPTPFLVLEKVEGRTLKALIEDRVPLEDLLDALAQVGQGVHHAHQKGVVHRDLKPANIMVDPSGRAVVMDFGIAALKEANHSGPQLTSQGVALGTPSYMAPEQAAGANDEIGPHSDVFSLGVILYECLAGKQPFEGEGIRELLVKIMFDEPTPPSTVAGDVPAALEELCLLCLQKKPEMRTATAAQFSERIQAFLRGDPILQARRKIWLVPIVAAVTLALGLGVGLWAGTDSPSTRDTEESNDQPPPARPSDPQPDAPPELSSTMHLRLVVPDGPGRWLEVGRTGPGLAPVGPPEPKPWLAHFFGEPRSTGKIGEEVRRLQLGGLFLEELTADQLFELGGDLGTLQRVVFSHCRIDAGVATRLAAQPRLSSVSFYSCQGLDKTVLERLADSPALQELIIERATLDFKAGALAPLSRMRRLRSLTIRGCPAPKQLDPLDLTPLKGLVHLERIDLSGTLIDSVHGIKALRSLRRLTDFRIMGFNALHVSDLNVVSRMSRLIRLEIHRGTWIQSAGWKKLPTPKSLEHLDMYESGTFDNEALAHIAACTSLKSLRLEATRVDSNGLQSLQKLTGLKSLHAKGSLVKSLALVNNLPLEEASLGGDRVPATDAVLKGLLAPTELRRLTLGNPRLSSDGLEHLRDRHPNLELLRFHGGKIEGGALRGLSDHPLRELLLISVRLDRPGFDGLTLPKLERLVLVNCKKAANILPHLHRFPNLERLTLRGCQLRDRDLTVLSRLPRLRQVDLSENPELTDKGIASLAGLEQLSELFLRRCKIKKNTLQHLLKKRPLRHLDLRYTKLTWPEIEALRKQAPGCWIR